MGCPAEAFHTLRDVTRNYGLALNPFLKELSETVESQKNNEQKETLTCKKDR
ncbi:conserved hypothetical protein [delta proteobacterium NaphS2]|nr:conserved hypothetical protein [delta proteobacterium NaphS2]EFK09968.1 conserved hypothetical protein [delta proteobacterium NaphS2]